MFRNLAVIALFAGAYASNPDEDSFQRFVELELKKYPHAALLRGFIYLLVARDGSHWVERKVVAHLSKNVYPREVGRSAAFYVCFTFSRITTFFP